MIRIYGKILWLFSVLSGTVEDNVDFSQEISIEESLENAKNVNFQQQH